MCIARFSIFDELENKSENKEDRMTSNVCVLAVMNILATTKIMTKHKLSLTMAFGFG